MGDSSFAGQIPQLYDRHLGPLLFEPYAHDLARRAAALAPSRVLETAAGTGVVTLALADALPDAEIVATDLNQAMLDVASKKLGDRVALQAADAQELPFSNESFDLVVCQYGAMFFSDRIGAYREVHRVLRPGGHLLFNMWDRIEENPAASLVAESVRLDFPDDPPDFLARTPYGHHDIARTVHELIAAGFSDIETETVRLSGRGTAEDAVFGFCHGSPLRAEIEARGNLFEVGERAITTVQEKFGKAPFANPMSAHVFLAAR